MQVWKSVQQWRARRAEMESAAIGFVPTMGALHNGHDFLVRRCRAENRIVVVSLFVNPTQFNDPRDLERYPRTLEADLARLAQIGADHVLVPTAGQLYPNGYEFRVEAPAYTECMEGLHRPGFFQGVMTVVLKLLNLVGPERAYFGAKDYQQYRVLEAMLADLFLPTQIVLCETVRTLAGLAESSRNRLLSDLGHVRAAGLYGALCQGRDVAETRAMIEAAGLKVDYVEEHWGRRFAAAYLEGVRLIDNVALDSDE
jgi:pantoate--beta-alanine ligase